MPIKRVTFGIRHGPNYRIGDNLGSIIDSVLRDRGTPFGPGVFPVGQAAPHEHSLVDTNTGDRVTISERDLILTKSLSPGGVNEVRKLAADYSQWIVKPVSEVGRVRGIIRYGILFELAECSASLKIPLTQRFLPDESSDAQDLLLRFSRRLQTEEGHFRKGVNDYRNIIYTLQQRTSGNALISVDYQEVFDPVLDRDDWKRKPFQTFAEAGISYFEGSFSRWLQTLLKDEAA